MDGFRLVSQTHFISASQNTTFEFLFKLNSTVDLFHSLELECGVIHSTAYDVNEKIFHAHFVVPNLRGHCVDEAIPKFVVNEYSDCDYRERRRRRIETIISIKTHCAPVTCCLIPNRRNPHWRKTKVGRKQISNGNETNINLICISLRSISILIHTKNITTQ